MTGADRTTHKIEKHKDGFHCPTDMCKETFPNPGSLRSHVMTCTPETVPAANKFNALSRNPPTVVRFVNQIQLKVAYKTLEVSAAMSQLAGPDELPYPPARFPPGFKTMNLLKLGGTTSAGSDVAQGSKPQVLPRRSVWGLLARNPSGQRPWYCAPQGTCWQLSGIHHHLEGCKAVILIEQISQTSQPAELGEWQPVIKSWLQSRMKSMHDGSSIQLRTVVMSTTIYSPCPFTSLQHNKTKSTYADTLLALLLFVFKRRGHKIASKWNEAQEPLMEAVWKFFSVPCFPQMRPLFPHVFCELPAHQVIHPVGRGAVCSILFAQGGRFLPQSKCPHARDFRHILHQSYSLLELLPTPSNQSGDQVERRKGGHSSLIQSFSLTLLNQLGCTVISNTQQPDLTHWLRSVNEKLCIKEHTVTVSGIWLAINSAVKRLDDLMCSIGNSSSFPTFNPTQLCNTNSNTQAEFNYLKATKDLYAHNQFYLPLSWMGGPDKRGINAKNWEECVGGKSSALGGIWR
ncbi:hypothetical protein MJO29_015888, partial [Puccinia striiformis f. sp. tritici]